MPRTFASRPVISGPSVDPGEAGWDAMGMGVHFTGADGQPGYLLGDLPLSQRLALLNRQADLSGVTTTAEMLGYGPETPAVSDAEFEAGSLYSQAVNARNRAAQPLVAANGMSLLTPAQQASMTPQQQFQKLQGNVDPTSGAISPADSPNAGADSYYAGLAGSDAALGAINPHSYTPSTPRPSYSQTAAPAPQAAAGATSGAPGAAPVSISGPAAAPRNATAPGAFTATTGQPIPGRLGASVVTPPGATTGQPMPTTAGPDTMSGTGDIIGSSANYWDPAYGGVPNVPDPISSQYQATVGNISNLGEIYGLAGSVNQFGAQQARSQYEQNLPGYDEMMATASGDILSNLRGQVPADVLNELAQGSAERGIATGVSGSANAGAQYLKALGLTSIGLQDKGQQQLTSAIQRTPTSPLFNVASQLVSPNDEQAARMAANMYAAAPNPRAAGEEAIRNAQAAIRAGAGGGGPGGVNLTGAGGPPANAGPTSGLPTTVYPGTNQAIPGTGTASNPYASWQRWYNQIPGTTGVPTTTTGTDNWASDIYGLGGSPGSVDPSTGIPYTQEGPSGTGYDPFGTTGGQEWWSDPSYDPFAEAGGQDVGYDEELGLFY